MKIISDPHLTEQYRFPRSHKKRIRKKWRKQQRNYKPSTNCFLITVDKEQSVICSPHVALILERERQEFLSVYGERILL